MDQRLLDDLLDWLRIPSISTGGGEPADLERAAAWVVQRVNAAGGEARVVATEGNPLAVGELRAARADAPTVLIYGHYDVQSVGDPAAWTTPPFAPDVRDGRVYARGASDDKGNFLPLLHVACAQAAAGTLPVNVRVLVEGEEEAGSVGVTDWVRADERRAGTWGRARGAPGRGGAWPARAAAPGAMASSEPSPTTSPLPGCRP